MNKVGCLLSTLGAAVASQKPGALVHNAKVRSEAVYCGLDVYAAAVGVRAEDGYVVTVLKGLEERAVDGRMGHEKRGWKLRKSPELLVFPAAIDYTEPHKSEQPK